MNSFKYKVFALFLIFSSLVYNQVPFNNTPDWISTDVSSVSTGGAFADIDKDGWLDYVVANGNDIFRQRLVVYYNTGNGTFPLAPGWQSMDIDYHGHIDIGDVNSDGYPDVAVSVYIGPSGFSSPGKVKLYLNNTGTLSSNPDWTSGDLLYSFSCAFGDADSDGDLDLAVSGGESYYNNPEQMRIYFNDSGMLENLPSWKSQTSFYSYDVSWADFDLDGDLDVVFAGEGNPNTIFENFGDSISVVPTWQSTDASMYANSLFVGDVNNDDYPDLAIADNNQLGGQGKFKIYLNDNGVLNSTPFWTSAFSGYGSGIMLADIDNDHYPDLITGGWWQPVRTYMNISGNFNINPDYTSTTSSVIEAIFCGDVDNDALQNITEYFVSDGNNNLYYFSHSHLSDLGKVIVGGDTLGYNEYCYDVECGWVMLASIPDSGIVISAEIVISLDLDIGITNWDQNKGNYLFYNNSAPVYTEAEISIPKKFILYQNYPNPFNPTTKIRFTILELQFTTLKIYNALGNEIATLVNDVKPAGSYKFDFDASGLPNGIYFYQLKAGSYLETKKMVLVK